MVALYLPDNAHPQMPADVAVVMPTVGRPSIVRALESIYAQSFPGRIQVLIGVDRKLHDLEPLGAKLEQRPANVSALFLRLPYSTSQLHGGVHAPADGGSLRAVLSLIANARLVAYLDDDNTWLEDHLRLLTAAVEGKIWAWSRRMLVDDESDADLGVDIWDSVGPGRGRISTEAAVDFEALPPEPGFVDPNCLIVDKAKAAHHFGQWAQTLKGNLSYSADKRFYLSLAHLEHAAVEAATVRYRIRNDNVLHKYLRAARRADQPSG